MKIKSQLEIGGHTGLQLKILRIQTGLKQWELAQKIGICQNTLSLIEIGRRIPSSDLLAKIKKALNETSVLKIKD